MKKSEFIANNAKLISAMMCLGSVEFLDVKNPEFKGIRWVFDFGLQWPDLRLLAEYNLIIGSIGRQDDQIMIWVMYDYQIEELHK